LSPAIRWLTGFGLLTFLFLWAERTHWFARTVLPSLSFLSAGAAHHGLSLLGISTQWNGEVLQTADASFEIAGSCTGAAVMLMYAAAVLPFPASWKHRLAGALAGMFALFALNTVRAVLIVAVGSRFPQAVWGLHVIVGQALVIAGAMALFFLWAGSSRTGHVPGLGPGLRAPAVFLALFLLGFLASYAIYRELLQSPLGRWTQEKVVAHAAWLLSWTGQASARELVLKTSSGTVRLIQGCLSSPLVVVASAVAFAWPAPWWKKLALIALGFFPFYYFYHLLRTVAVVMVLSAQGGGKELNTAYNFFGQIILAGALLATVSHFRSKRETHRRSRGLARLLGASVAALVTALLLGHATRRWLLPLWMNWVTGSSSLRHDPLQSLATMVDFQTFVWLALWWSTSGLSGRRQFMGAFAGILVALALFLGTTAATELLHLAPHQGLLKAGIVALPAGIYAWIFLRPPLLISTASEDRTTGPDACG